MSLAPYILVVVTGLLWVLQRPKRDPGFANRNLKVLLSTVKRLSLPGMTLVIPSYRRNKKLAEGLCLNCGYNMFASPVRCPECGVVFGKMKVKRVSPVKKITVFCIAVAVTWLLILRAK
jgi:hypothetical protein